MLALALAVVVATPTSAPSTPPTIQTVRSTPFCSALQRHFNAAFVPMLGNNRSLRIVGGELDDLNGLFTRPTYASDFYVVRGHMMRQVGEIERALPQIGAQIGRLRAGAALTNDAVAREQMLATVSSLEAAYAMQRQIAYDLHGLVQSMMEYDPLAHDHSAGGMDPSELGVPRDMRDIKSYLRYDSRRDTMEKAQSTAVDRALALAQSSCQ